jgi:putative membrane protein
MNTRPLHLLLSAVFFTVLVWSGHAPYDRATWWMEVAPALIAFPLLLVTRRRFPLTDLLYVLILLHAVVLMVGGAYSYARVPAGFAVQEWLALARNPYDKLGHFMQGFVPALVAREILLRRGYLRRGAMLAFVCLCIVMAISAWYELIEWAAAVSLGQGADEFLGSQGDPWDTQSDMFMAMLGGVAALSLLAGWQDRQIARLPRPGADSGADPGAAVGGLPSQRRG